MTEINPDVLDTWIKVQLLNKYTDHKGNLTEIEDDKLITIAVIGGEESGLIERLSECDFSKGSNIRLRKVENDREAGFGKITTLGLSYKWDKKNELLLRFIELKDELSVTTKEKIICLSSAVLVAVDSPSVMNGLNDETNIEDNSIKFLLSQFLPEDKLVLFVPVRCELNMFTTKADEDMRALCLKLQNKYEDTIKFLRNGNGTVAITPVITEFSVKNMPKTFFGRLNKKVLEWSCRMKMLPLFQEQLLLTLVRFKLETLRQHKNKIVKKSLFKELTRITRIIKNETEWNKLIAGKTVVYGINPEKSEQGFHILHDPSKYFKDLN